MYCVGTQVSQEGATQHGSKKSVGTLKSALEAQEQSQAERSRWVNTVSKADVPDTVLFRCSQHPTWSVMHLIEKSHILML